MCGRFSLTVQEDEIERLFRVAVDRKMYVPRYNGSPSQLMAVIKGGEKRAFTMMRWGLVPFWAKDPSVGSRMINARSETILAKPSFKMAFRQRRCLVPADGFFEWKKNGKKQAFRFVMKDHALFAMAGIWERWMDPAGSELQTFCILTTAANDLIQGIHDRMPVILPPETHEDYLQGTDPDQLTALLRPFPTGRMAYYQVSDLVNFPGNDDARVIAPLKPSSPGLF